jgi:hypothetical protein
MPVDLRQKPEKPNEVILARGTDALSITFARTRRLLYWIADVGDRAGAGGIAWPNRQIIG